MRVFVFSLTLLLLQQLPNTANAKIWRINNTGIPADFTSANAASSSSSVVNGDTLHIEPSGVSYGDLNINKRLVVIGNGYFLGDASANLNPNLQANTGRSILNGVGVGPGGNGTVIMGITCTDFVIAANDVVFKRNNAISIQIGTDFVVNNSQILQNYVQWMAGTLGVGTNMVISNNIIVAFANFTSNDNGIFTNNVLVATGAYANQGGGLALTNFIVRNNIVVQSPFGISLVNCTVQNNTDCTGASGFGTSNGNTGNVDMSTVFAGWPTLGSFSTDGRFALKAGSPALGTGFGGSDRGAILNPANSSNNMADTYVLSGIPTVPSLFRFDVPTSVSAGTMNVTISTRTNQ